MNETVDSKEKAWERYWETLMRQCEIEQAEQEDMVSLIKKTDCEKYDHE